jgi:hypothetical protein
MRPRIFVSVTVLTLLGAGFTAETAAAPSAPGGVPEPQGFFLDAFAPKTAPKPAFRPEKPPAGKPTVTVSFHAADTLGRVSPWLNGDNANVYMGQIVDEPVLLRRLKMLSPAVLRYPGGNLTNSFFWNADSGSAPADAPDSLIYNGAAGPPHYWYGRNADTLTLSVENFYRTLRETGSGGLICVNAGYARYGTGPDPVRTAAHLAADWVRTDAGRTRFWEIGNENFGPWQAGFAIDTAANRDGQPRVISGALYGRHFRVFADSMRAAARSVGSDIRLGAVIVEVPKGPGWYNPVEENWNRGVLETAGGAMDFFSIHSYYTPYNENSTAETILESAGAETARMMDAMKDLCARHGLPPKPVALTEWNLFAVGSGQQTSFINALHAALVMGSLAVHGYGLAARWDLVNRWVDGNDHGLFSYGDEPGVGRWNPRPPYFVMHYYRNFFGDRLVRASVVGGAGSSKVRAFASLFHSGEAGLVLVNTGTEDETVRVEAEGFRPAGRYYRMSLTGGDDHAPFSRKVFVNGRGPGGPAGGPIDGLEDIPAWTRKIRGGFAVPLPARSVQFLLIEGKR